MSTFRKKHKAYAEQLREASRTHEQNEALVELMVIAACIDGILAPGEKETLSEMIRAMPGFDLLDNKGLARAVNEVTERVARDGIDVRVEVIARELGHSQKLKEHAFSLACVFVHFDGEVGDEEQNFLTALQQKLGLSDERASHLDSLITEYTEASGS